MPERSIEIFKDLQESLQRFDYFMLGLSAALFAYIGENYVPSSPALNAATIELAALVFLAISIFAGVKRLEIHIGMKSMNFNLLHLSEKRGEINKALADPGPKINTQTGDVFDPQLAAYESKLIEENIPKIESSISTAQDRAGLSIKLETGAFWSHLCCLRLLKLR